MSDENQNRKLLSIDELAEAINMKKSWIYNATMRKDADSIPRFKVGKYLRFVENDVREWMKRFAVGMKNAT